MIASFRDAETKRVFEGIRSRRFEGIARIAGRKLQLLEFAGSLEDLRNPRGNGLEALKGDRLGQHSIRVNDQYRLCFRWVGEFAYDVELVDYH